MNNPRREIYRKKAICQYGSNCNGISNKKCNREHPEMNIRSENRPFKQKGPRLCKYGENCHDNTLGRCAFSHENNLAGQKRSPKNSNLIQTTGIDLNLKKNLADLSTKCFKNETKHLFLNTLSQVNLARIDFDGLMSIATIIISAKEYQHQDKAVFFYELSCIDFFYNVEILRIIGREVSKAKLVNTKVNFGISIVDALLCFFSEVLKVNQRIANQIDIQTFSEFLNQFSSQMLEKHYSFPIGSQEKATAALLKGFGDRVIVLTENIRLLTQQKNQNQGHLANSTPTQPSEIIEEETLEGNDLLQPPDNYKTINLFYDIVEMKNEMPFLRKLRINRPYNNLEEYLDTHFRLLIEDFYSSVKLGIQVHVQNANRINPKRAKLEGLYTFTGYATELVAASQAICVKIKIPLVKKQTLSFKRFIFGSMVLLTYNDFQTFLICIIRDKNDRMLKKNKGNNRYIEVLVEVMSQGYTSWDVMAEYKNREILLAESGTYFESYYHCLKNLQIMTSLPFTNLLVRCRVNENDMPQYLCSYNSDYPNRMQQELTPEVLNEIARHVKIGNLDESQRNAITHAFHKELCIIQGPPGTGKTYVSVIIIRILLQLRHLIGGPIFIICYTNHALDQFLEHLMPFTKNITRLGGRCKNEKLLQFTLKNKREKNKLLRSKEAGFYTFKIRSNERKFRMFSENFTFCERLKIISKTSIFEDNKLWLLESVESEYKYRLDMFVKSLGKHKSKFEKYIRERLKPISDFTQAMFYWLDLIDFEVVYQELLSHFEYRKKEKEQDLANAEAEFVEVAGKALLAENNHLPEEEDFYLDYFRSTESIDDFLNGPPLYHTEKNYETIMDMIIGEWEYYLKPDDQNKLVYQNFKGVFNAPIKTIGDSYISIEDRWAINNHFVNRFKEEAQAKMAVLADSISDWREKLQEAENTALSESIKGNDIIGVTTTGAAKHTNLLRKVNSKITLIEEAAEVLESHIITSLTKTMKHLILVGDHKQLRPKVNSMELASKYNLEISLFERLVKNKFPKVEIEVQRRMRPEISEIIRIFYPSLKDDNSVSGRPHIRGLTKDVFFFTHEWAEEKLEFAKESHSNKKEADFIIKFAEFLIKNNYQQEEIIVLSLYTGQLLYIKTQMTKSNILANIRVCTVDDFQGEEGKIILLSLVRSNSDSRIGFLQFDNRINVAFSRAKDGFYVFGNAKCIRSFYNKKQNTKPSLLLYDILVHCQKKNILDDKIEIKCSNHGTVNYLKDVYDFNMCPEGGCDKICKSRLNCGHDCKIFCHNFEITTNDTDGHRSYSCLEPCRRNHNCSHGCNKTCASCDPTKFICKKPVPIIHPMCKHNYDVPCNLKDHPNSRLCQANCNLTLKCGHPCYRRCHEKCLEISLEQVEKGFETSCTHKMTVKLPCGHEARKPCGQNMLSFFKEKICYSICDAKLECGDNCSGLCKDCRKIVNGKVRYYHADCSKKCKRIQHCGHECKDKCPGVNGCSPCSVPCKTRCLHSNCPKKCGEICANCVEDCIYKCEHYQCNKHCHEICDRPPCQKPCNKKLAKCGHPCIGYCGEECPDVCRQCDPENEAFQIFFGDEDEPDQKFVMLDCCHSFSGASLDRYFNEYVSKTTAVVYPTCPKCKRNVYFCTRYQAVIKTITKKLNIIKMRILQTVNTEYIKIKNFRFDPSLVKLFEFFPELTHHCKNVYDCCEKCEKSSQKLNSINRIIDISKYMGSVLALVTENQLANDEFIMKILAWLPKKIINPAISEQNSKIIMNAIKSLDFYLRFKKAIREWAIDLFGERIKDSDKLIKQMKRFVSDIIKDEGLIDDDVCKEMQDFLTINAHLLQKIGLNTPEQYQRLNKILNLGNGHWNVCPNGHPYLIGDCGGAMEIARCPECNLEIGGNSYQLTTGNRPANLDGSGPSWDPGNIERDLRMAHELQNEFQLEQRLIGNRRGNRGRAFL